MPLNVSRLRRWFAVAAILVIVVALQAIPAFARVAEVRSSVLRGPLFGVHVSSLMFAYASFALACVIGITYVLLFKEIKAKHLGFFYARLPSLQVLGTMNQRGIAVGWIFLTVGASSFQPALSADGASFRFPFWDFSSPYNNFSQIYFDTTVSL